MNDAAHNKRFEMVQTDNRLGSKLVVGCDWNTVEIMTMDVESTAGQTIYPNAVPANNSAMSLCNSM